jgi:ribonuclease VapC
MIVVDTSAIIAVMLEEPGWEAIVPRLMADPDRVLSPVCLVEAILVLSRTYSEPNVIVDEYLQQANIFVRAVDEAQARLAVYAFLAFGKGRHPARLNLADCFSYAAAQALKAPLLYIGQDFTQTDIRAA